MAIFQLKTLYPKIAHIVNTDLPNFARDSKKFNAFKRFGDFSDKEARQALKPGFPPTIKIMVLPVRQWGWYSMSGNDIHLNKVITKQYEQLHLQCLQRLRSPQFTNPQLSIRNSTNDKEIARWRYTIAQARLHIEATIIHEIVHWGDHFDGISKKRDALNKGWSDAGHQFVFIAYGREIDVSTFQLTKGRTLKQSDFNVNGWLGWDKYGQPFYGKEGIGVRP